MYQSVTFHPESKKDCKGLLVCKQPQASFRYLSNTLQPPLAMGTGQALRHPRTFGYFHLRRAVNFWHAAYWGGVVGCTRQTQTYRASVSPRPPPPPPPPLPPAFPLFSPAPGFLSFCPLFPPSFPRDYLFPPVPPPHPPPCLTPGFPCPPSFPPISPRFPVSFLFFRGL